MDGTYSVGVEKGKSTSTPGLKPRAESSSPFGTKRVPRHLHSVPRACSICEQCDPQPIHRLPFLAGNNRVRTRQIGLAHPLLSASATFVTPRLFYESRCSPPIRH